MQIIMWINEPVSGSAQVDLTPPLRPHGCFLSSGLQHLSLD